jgi:hypothetical protein
VEYTELAKDSLVRWKSVFTRGCQTMSTRSRTIIYRSCLMITLYQPPDNCMINIELYSNISWAHTSIWHSNIRRLHNAHLRARRPVKRPYLSPHHRQARLQWANDHLLWNIRNWQKIHLSDESWFFLLPVDRRIRVWRQFCCWCEWTPFWTSSEKSVFTRGCQTRSTRSRTIIYRSCLMITLYQPPDNCIVSLKRVVGL